MGKIGIFRLKKPPASWKEELQIGKTGGRWVKQGFSGWDG
jgi:hypothetical protein